MSQFENFPKKRRTTETKQKYEKREKQLDSKTPKRVTMFENGENNNNDFDMSYNTWNPLYFTPTCLPNGIGIVSVATPSEKKKYNNVQLNPPSNELTRDDLSQMKRIEFLMSDHEEQKRFSSRNLLRTQEVVEDFCNTCAMVQEIQTKSQIQRDKIREEIHQLKYRAQETRRILTICEQFNTKLKPKATRELFGKPRERPSFMSETVVNILADDIDIILDPAEKIADKLLITSWEHIEEMEKEEINIILASLCKKGYHKNKSFIETVNNCGMNWIPKERIFLQKHHTHETKQKLLGLYLKKLPRNLIPFDEKKQNVRWRSPEQYE